MKHYRYRRIPFYPSKNIGFALLGVFLLTLIPFASLGEAAPTGYFAYAVNGFDENLGRFDWNLYITEISSTKDLKPVPLNHKGMYPSWGPDGAVLYFIQRDAGQSDIYAIDPESPKNKKRITPTSGTYRFLFRFSEWQTTRFQRLYPEPVAPRKPDLGAGYRDGRDGSYDGGTTRRDGHTHFGGSLGRPTENGSPFRFPDPDGWNTSTLLDVENQRDRNLD